MGLWYVLILLQAWHIMSTLSRIYSIPSQDAEKQSVFWYDLGEREIMEALERKENNGKAKNIIFFLGDGMGISVSTAGRIYKEQKTRGVSGEEGYLAWERFPNVGLLKTYNLDKQVPDSAATATAYLTGVKANYYTIGVDGRVKEGDCRASLDRSTHATSVLVWAQADGKDTGFVTTTRVTHATPAALYAHSSHREWESDTDKEKLNPESGECLDIARQLMEEDPGCKINVIFGGGRAKFGATNRSTRSDRQNLTEVWRMDKEAVGASYAYVTNTKELQAVNLKNSDFILGLFDESHLPYHVDNSSDSPSLKIMTAAAIERLSRQKNGFFLLVEGGRIDHGLHDTKTRRALEDIVAFDEAVAHAVELFKNDKETLIIVTADHSHAMAMNGYPARGNDILGVTTYEYVTDGLPYTTIMYTNGVGFNFTYDNITQKVSRTNLSGIDTTHPDFIGQVAVPTELGYETHGGEDVAVYALGPMSHLFHRLHEQSYVAHVMAFAACIGPYKDCTSKNKNEEMANKLKSSASSVTGNLGLYISAGYLLYGFCRHCKP